MLLKFSLMTVLIVCTASLATVDDTIEPLRGRGPSAQTTERVLSRRRRYLIFPEGSSLQLVYDSVVTIPDYTIYVVTGVTVALAWGLPFKPTYPDDELQEQYEQGHLPLLGRDDANITDSQYVDTKKAKGKKSKSKSKSKSKTKTTAAEPTTTPAPMNADRQSDDLLTLFQNIHQSQSNRYGPFPYGQGQSYYQRPYQPQYRPHDSIRYDYSQRNNSRPSDRHYFGPSRSDAAPITMHRPMATQSISRPLLSADAAHANRKNYDYASLVDQGLDAVNAGAPTSTSTRSPMIRPSPPTTRRPPNPYAELIRYMSDTYSRPWQQTDWQENVDDQTTTKKPTKARTKAKKSKTKTPEFKPIIRKLHTIYPAMGKRSIVDHTATYEEKFYLDHHRNTRHELFGLIEKYVTAKGFNGTVCVLKTLCEIGQRRDDDQPGSFLTEIVRAIFSLPRAQLKAPVKRAHKDYDIAHNAVDNCATRYTECTESIWNAAFLLEMIE